MSGKQTEKQDRIRGCLLGGAVGDALGYAVEFSHEKQIFREYGKDGIREYEIDLKSGKAQISDDTQMTLFTANGILVCETGNCLRGAAELPRNDIADAYLDWLITQERRYKEVDREKIRPSRSWLLDVPELYSPRAPGRTCLMALRELRKTEDRTEDYIAEPCNHSKGCGGIMRVAPVAIYYGDGSKAGDAPGRDGAPDSNGAPENDGAPAHGDAPDLTWVDIEGAQAAAITHGHSLGYLPAAVFVHIISRVLYGEDPDLKRIVEEAMDTVSTAFAGDENLPQLQRIVELAIELSENGDSDLANIHRLGEGWVAEETLAISVYCALRYPDDFEAGVASSVNHKGDSDSTGAVTGNILGARLGYEAIPEKYKKDLELSDVILEMADDLCRRCQVGGDGSAEDPSWISKYVKMTWKEQELK